MRNAIHFLGGSIAVYTLMAACSSAGRGSRDSGPGPIAIQGGAHAQGGVNGATTAGASNPSDAQQGNGGSSMGGIVNTMMDPVDDADAAPATSGTRLRARYYTGEDGSKQFIGWHDKMRDEDCTFQKSEDGKWRCLPTVSGYGTYFADAACGNAVAYISTAATCAQPVVPTYLADLASVTCDSAFKVFKVGAEITPSTLYVKSGQDCTMTTATDSWRYFATTHIAPSDFVAATEEVE